MQVSYKYPNNLPSWLNALLSISIDVIRLLNPSTKSILLIGSAAEKILSGDFEDLEDLDIVFVVDQDFSPGDVLLDLIVFEKMITERTSNNQMNLTISYNGIPMHGFLSKSDSLQLDLIPESFGFINNNDPFSVLDIAKRMRIILYGNDYHNSLSHCRITNELFQARVQITMDYISREYFKKNLPEQLSMRYIAKSAILLSSYLLIELNPTLNKNSIVEQVSKQYPALSQQLRFFFHVYQGIQSISTKKLQEQLENYVAILKSIFQKEYGPT